MVGGFCFANQVVRDPDCHAQGFRLLPDNGWPPGAQVSAGLLFLSVGSAFLTFRFAQFGVYTHVLLWGSKGNARRGLRKGAYPFRAFRARGNWQENKAAGVSNMRKNLKQKHARLQRDLIFPVHHQFEFRIGISIQDVVNIFENFTFLQRISCSKAIVKWI